MADIVSRSKRSEMMSGIKGKDTKPELKVRLALHKLGFRYKLYDKTLPGKPDLVFPKHKAIIFIHGCFWHLHDCHLFKWPSSRSIFWREKITGNRERDENNVRILLESGWRVMIIWECAVKGKTRIPLDCIIKKSTEWLLSNHIRGEINGDTNC